MDVGLELNSKTWKLIAYKQSVYDDGSLFKRTNLTDGLYGISLKANENTDLFLGLKGLTLELLNTVSQGGPLFTTASLGRDNYFNHTQFYGWVYARNTIGTPFITPSGVTNFNVPGRGFTNNNRVQLFHVGLNGQLSGIQYLVKASYSDNLGTYDYPFNIGVNQTSLLINLSKKFHQKALGELEGFAITGVDIGKLYQHSIGIYFGIRKNGVFRHKEMAKSSPFTP